MDHSTAARSAAAERYVLGELSAEDGARFEAHYFDCPECAEDVRALVAFVDGARSLVAEPARAGLMTRGARVAERWSRPALLLPMAATLAVALGVAVYQSAVTVPRLRGELARLAAPQETSWHFLKVARGSAPDIRVRPQQRMIGLTLSRSEPESFPFYRLEVRDDQGDSVLATGVSAPPQGEELQLLLPLAHLQAGRYTIVLSGLETRDGPVVAPAVVQYAFRLIREEGR
jgi:hypothetical protein